MRYFGFEKLIRSFFIKTVVALNWNVILLRNDRTLRLRSVLNTLFVIARLNIYCLNRWLYFFMNLSISLK